MVMFGVWWCGVVWCVSVTSEEGITVEQRREGQVCLVSPVLFIKHLQRLESRQRKVKSSAER